MSMMDPMLPEDRAAAAEGSHEPRERSSRSYMGPAGSITYLLCMAWAGTRETEPVLPVSQQQYRCLAWLPLNDKEASLFFSKVTDTSVMGLVTLATFFSTYLLAWGKPGTNCIPYFNNSVNVNVTLNVSDANPSWQQIVVGLLPFAVFPIALYLSGLGKIAETETRALSVVSSICLGEFIITFVLGGMMGHCMAGLSVWVAIGVVVIAVLVTIVVWAFTFKHPKFLRSIICSRCTRRTDT